MSYRLAGTPAMASAAEQAFMARIEGLESFVNSNKLPGPQGVGERNLAKTVLDMEICVSTLIDHPHAKDKRQRSLRRQNQKGLRRTH